MLRAHIECGLRMPSMAAELSLTVGRINQLIAKAEIKAAKNKEKDLRPAAEFIASKLVLQGRPRTPRPQF